MAQILIRKRQHFAELVKPAEWSDLEWAGRPLRGDVVEVRPNGYWRIEALGTGDKGWDRDAFALIQITNVSAEDLAYLDQCYSNATVSTPATVVFKSRYHFPNWAAVPWIKNTITVGTPPVTVEEWYYIRATLGVQVQPIDKVT